VGVGICGDIPSCVCGHCSKLRVWALFQVACVGIVPSCVCGHCSKLCVWESFWWVGVSDWCVDVAVGVGVIFRVESVG